MSEMALTSSLPQLHLWSTLVDRYSPRRLTSEADITRAVAGATEVLSSKFPDGILNGLPIFFFDIALLREAASFEVERRPGQPSWSWTGWTSEVRTSETWCRYYSEGDEEDLALTNHWKYTAALRPIATYQLAANTSGRTTSWWRSPFLNDFYNYQNYRFDATISLPPGWRRHQHAQGDYFTCNQQQSTMYPFPLPIAESFPSLNSTSHLI